MKSETEVDGTGRAQEGSRPSLPHSPAESDDEAYRFISVQNLRESWK